MNGLKRRTLFKFALAGIVIAVLPLRALRASVTGQIAIDATNSLADGLVYWDGATKGTSSTSLINEGVWNKMLTDKQIEELHNPNSRWNLYKPYTGKIFYFPMEKLK